MTHRPRLIATDLDGTIIPFDGVISQRTINAFAMAERAGARIVYATGRPPRWMHDVRDVLGPHLAICGNGALIYDLRENALVKTNLLDAETTAAVVEQLRLVLPKAHFAVEGLNGYHRESDYNARWDAGVDLFGVERIEESISGPVAKLLVRSPNELISVDSMLATAIETVGALAQVTHSAMPDDSLLEISALGVTKGTALADLAAEWGIDQADVVTFGDNQNDISMLEWAGRSWAMGDAHPAAVVAAKSRTTTAHEDGVAAVLEELFA
jgi:Cof subfamily protein (haloacid dehalogenase superfamily)